MATGEVVEAVRLLSDYTKQIPHYKPSKNKVLFNLDDVEAWLHGTRVDPE